MVWYILIWFGCDGINISWYNICRLSEGDIYVFFIEIVEVDMMVGRVE